jgi:hypothetical protein
MDVPQLTLEQRRALTAPARAARQRNMLQRRLNEAKQLLLEHGYIVQDPQPELDIQQRGA